MPVYWSELLSVFVVFWCCFCVSAIDNKPKSVVFSYASASHPHVATLSHHYIAPPERQSQLELSDKNTQHYVPAGKNSLLPNSAAEQYPPSLPSAADQTYHPEKYSEHFHQQDGHQQQGNGIPHYDYRNSDINQPPMDSPSPNYDHSAISPHGYESSTVVYHQHNQPPDHRNYHPFLTTEPPFDYDVHSVNGHSTVTPNFGYQSTPFYYNGKPPDNNPNIQSPSYDDPQGYDHPPTSLIYPKETYHDGIENTNQHSQPLPDNQGEKFHGYTTPQQIYNNNNNNNNKHIHYLSPQNFHNGENPQPESNLTLSSQTYQYPNSDGLPNQTFPDYQSPASPEYFDYSSQHPPRGGKIFPPSQPSTSQVYYEEEIEYISTTPIVEFESTKEKLPTIKDEPSPKPGYITGPFKSGKSPLIVLGKAINKKELRTRRPPKASAKNSVAHFSNDKVLQRPKYFAYSTDSLHDNGDIDGGIEQTGDESEENQEDHVHQHKKKDEKHSKGGGQEHHSAHKATNGEKGDKGYKSEHKYEEEKKGHHEKEDYKGKYVDEKGKKGKKEEEGGHYGEHHKAEKGEKATKFGESGEHKKGHSTKGEHNVHKVDEYMKKHEFYDEHHEGGDHEKFGGFMAAHAHKKGAKKKKGHRKGGHHHKHRGKKGHHEKGHKLGQHKGHKDAKGYDGQFSKHKKYGKKGGSKKGKMWGYSKGHPPK